ncbi:protein KRI1 homolog [Cylas formicarius]|uniref:protein KRI1 homolog n=1 Tax=Cylas formicarius TaxID=197179 RepID=UPI002958CBCB|nr:protein KRI1 homolog [Cylas formicarius]
MMNRGLKKRLDLFDEDPLDVDDFKVKTENEYAKNYDIWRKKEELNKLKTKYGDVSMDLNSDENSESSSSDDDEEAIELTEATEKDFFKTLSYLKTKNPKIYDTNVNFFTSDTTGKRDKKKEAPLSIKDYEREMVLRKEGIVEKDNKLGSQERLEHSEIAKSFFTNDDDEDSDEDFLKVRENGDKKIQDGDFKKWLAGEIEQVTDTEVETALMPLKKYWNDPHLNEGEKFLKDYLLNKRYISNEGKDYIPTYHDVVNHLEEGSSGDEEHLERQEEFEHKYNFRFEEPDPEFIKRYPRTIEQSMRKTDDRRKLKRAETKARKQKEKEEKMAEIRKLRELKRKEIEEKIEKLKEVAGTESFEFNENDLDGDFDPEAHDRKMREMFSDQFYQTQGEEQKPEFPDIDEELEIENWDKWGGNHEAFKEEPHCEDDDFNMDADYDPTAPREKDLEEVKGKRKRKRKSKVAEALQRPKPKFDPADKTYDQYFDEYYKLDCEDIIGDIPCRFKYREVVPNDFGLTIEEILIAKDRELNRWCSLKKAVQIRPENVERYEQIAYSKKANNVALKKKLLPSLFEDEQEDTKSKVEIKTEPVEETNSIAENSPAKKKKYNEKKATQVAEGRSAKEEVAEIAFNIEPDPQEKKKKNKLKNIEIEKKSEKRKVSIGGQQEAKRLKKADSAPLDVGIGMNGITENSPAKTKKIKEKTETQVTEDRLTKDVAGLVHKAKPGPKKMKKKKQQQKNVKSAKKSGKRKVSMGGQQGATLDIGISDQRLTAYGINPKKYKNKLKYRKK